MKLLLHICCGPCAMYPVDYILNKVDDTEITGLYYNPNIHPVDEFRRRRENVQLMAEHYGINVLYMDDYMEEYWKKFGDPEDKSRCRMCYDTRLSYTAAYAANNGFDAFSTTLLVSPYQMHDYIITRSEAEADKNGVTFFYRDFREGFRLGQQMARNIGLYRQKYCGCCYSLPK